MTTCNLCNYAVSLQPGFLCLEDLDQGGMTITNAAEWVIQQLARDGFDLVKNRVIFRDTLGHWDELVVRENQFVGFAPLNATSQAQAIANASSGYPIRNGTAEVFFGGQGG
jgi:hypothetical protein